MSYAEVKKMFNDETTDIILLKLWKRGQKHKSMPDVRTVTQKQLRNVLDNTSKTEYDVFSYAYGSFSLTKTPTFNLIVVTRK